MTSRTSTNTSATADTCDDCGAVVAQGKAGCLLLFEEILAREFSDYRYGRIHRLTVDAYALQHPDSYMKSGKSFVAHLTGMCAAFEFEDTLVLNQAVQKWLSTNPQIQKPAEIPNERGTLTVKYVHAAVDAEQHTKRVREWARDVWAAWSQHHSLAKQLIDEANSGVTIHR
jgi:hypothetical protein